MVAPVRRKKVDRPALLNSLAQGAGERRLLRRGRDRGLGGAIRDRRLRTGPHDVRYRHVVAEERLRAGVDVDDRCQAGLVEAPEIEKRAVLAERIDVGRVVHANLVVAEEQDHAGADVLRQAAAAIAIGGGWEERAASSHRRRLSLLVALGEAAAGSATIDRAMPRINLTPVVAAFCLVAAAPAPLTADTYPRQPGIRITNYTFDYTLTDASNEMVVKEGVDVTVLAAGVKTIELDLCKFSAAVRPAQMANGFADPCAEPGGGRGGGAAPSGGKGMTVTAVAAGDQ